MASARRTSSHTHRYSKSGVGRRKSVKGSPPILCSGSRLDSPLSLLCDQKTESVSTLWIDILPHGSPFLPYYYLFEKWSLKKISIQTNRSEETRSCLIHHFHFGSYLKLRLGTHTLHHSREALCNFSPIFPFGSVFLVRIQLRLHSAIINVWSSRKTRQFKSSFT